MTFVTVIAITHAPSVHCGQLMRTVPIALILTASGLAFAARPAFAESMVTDRPTAGEASVTVGLQNFQIEVGPDIQIDSAAGTDTRSLRTPVELRYGIAEQTELVLQSAGFSSDAVTTDGDREETNGVSDLELGLKSHFYGGGYGTPSTGMSITFTIPVGSAAFRSDTVIPSVRLLFDWALPAQIGVGANVGVTFLSQSDPRTFGRNHVPVFWSVGAGRQIVGPLGGFVEAFGEIPTRSGFEGQTSADAGLLFLLSEDIQFDVAVRAGITPNAPDFGATAGVSFRHDWGSRY